jgi:hypothetical protein
VSISVGSVALVAAAVGAFHNVTASVIVAVLIGSWLPMGVRDAIRSRRAVREVELRGDTVSLLLRAGRRLDLPATEISEIRLPRWNPASVPFRLVTDAHGAFDVFRLSHVHDLTVELRLRNPDVRTIGPGR